MPKTKHAAALPKYHRKHWIPGGLPTSGRRWQPGRRQPDAAGHTQHPSLARSLAQTNAQHPWKWPKRTIYFIADPHADAEAFNASLAASGGVYKSGPGDATVKLSPAGRKGRFILGGDCLDKGPGNLRLLHSVHKLMQSGARVKLLAGNHDIRLLMGLRALQLKRNPGTEHLFVRMGPKVVPLFKEIHARYLDGKEASRGIPGGRECRRRLYPSERWFDEFPKRAAGLLSEPGIERELARMRKKVVSFEAACNAAGLSMRDVYATARKCTALFLKPGGEFAWFFREMQLAYREGSFLFIHAGLDDRVSGLIESRGIARLNRLFRRQVKRDLFDFYYGPVANTLRTKYRDVDLPLTRPGVERAYRKGIYAIVHGHRNRTRGQLIMLRQGMIHIESDITMDRNSRRKAGLDGYGVGVTIVRPEGRIIGISTDYPYAKVFEPGQYINQRAVRAHAAK